jgi:hypothetical protein
MTTASTLEVLRTAEATLSNEEMAWDFMDGSACTCGHLYAAYLNDQPGKVLNICASAEDPTYSKIACEVASALGWTPPVITPENEPYYSVGEDALWYISDATSGLAKTEHEDEDEDYTIEREHGLAVIRKAIAEIEGREEAARSPGGGGMTTAELLRAAKAVIDTPERWTHGRWVDSETNSCCSVGAIMAARGLQYYSSALEADPVALEAATLLAQAAVDDRDWDLAVNWNDIQGRTWDLAVNWNDIQGRTHDEVMAAFDRAIELAEAA